MSHARLSNYRQSPRKVRLVADMVRGKKLSHVLPVLDVLGKRAALPLKKLIRSAQANAVHNEGLDKEKLFISEIRVDEGYTLKRHRPRARGRAFPIRKRTSHIFVRLGEVLPEEKEEAKGKKDKNTVKSEMTTVAKKGNDTNTK